MTRSARLIAAPLLVALLPAAGPDPLPGLLQALRQAPDPGQAAALETRIVAAWHARQTPAVQLLAERAARALAAGKPADAAADAEAATDLAPDQSELWRLRAEAAQAAGQRAKAGASLARALALDPANFAALRDLSLLAEAEGNATAALSAWQRLLALDPQTPGGQDRLRTLTRKAQAEHA